MSNLSSESVKLDLSDIDDVPRIQEYSDYNPSGNLVEESQKVDEEIPRDNQNDSGSIASSEPVLNKDLEINSVKKGNVIDVNVNNLITMESSASYKESIHEPIILHPKEIKSQIMAEMKSTFSVNSTLKSGCCEIE